MSPARPHIQITLDKKTDKLLALIAKREQQTKSVIAAKLIQIAIDLDEDIILSHFADERMKNTQRWVSHEKVWNTKTA